MKKTKMSIALFLILTFVATIVTLPILSAHDPPWNIPTATYVNIVPNPIGVGQEAIVTFMLHMPPPTAEGPYGDRWTFTVDVTKPDGSIETLGPFTSDPVGGSYTLYTPDQVGKYSFVAKFPGQTLAGENPPTLGFTRGGELAIGDYYEPSNSDIVSLTVQQDPIEMPPETPIPDDYWEHPIYGENRAWGSIAGHWLMASSPFRTIDSDPLGYQPYGEAPNTAHIVWKRQIAPGGLVGGPFDAEPYYSGMSYEQKFRKMVIISGVLYFLKHANPSRDPYVYPPGVYAVDLRTGEELWYNPDMRLDFAQIYSYHSGNQHGPIPYLWETNGSTWLAYDPFTGDWLYTIENVPGGTSVFASDGSILRYRLTSNTLSMWNSSSIPELTGYLPFARSRSGTGTREWQWRPAGKIVDGRNGTQWTIDIPTVSGQGIRRISDGVIIATSLNTGDGFPYTMTHIGYSATTGERMWLKEHPWYSYSAIYGPAMDGVYTIYTHKDLTFKGYNVFSGEELWESAPLDNSFDLYERNFVGAYGRIYSTSISGRVYCIDIKTGERLWTFFPGSAGYQTPYGHWPFLTDLTVADGKIFAINGEHSATTPYFRGEKLHAIDAYTGEAVWNISHYSGSYECAIAADGYLIPPGNIYDNSIYCFGKGPTKTTVTGPEAVQPLGTSVLIKGMVIDESPGTKKDEAAIFHPDGVPAIADEYMTGWMEYLYMQQPIPMMANGVEVKLETLDPNGNFYEIETVTSDTTGMFKLMWEPPVPGEYTIIATFEGSNSYYSSYAETAIGVEEAVSTGAPLEPEPTEAPIVSTEMAIIIAAVIVAIAVLAGFWIIRKRK
jgi:outer membrane protein assembly factor BamB